MPWATGRHPSGDNAADETSEDNDEEDEGYDDDNFDSASESAVGLDTMGKTGRSSMANMNSEPLASVAEGHPKEEHRNESRGSKRSGSRRSSSKSKSRSSNSRSSSSRSRSRSSSRSSSRGNKSPRSSQKAQSPRPNPDPHPDPDLESKVQNPPATTPKAIAPSSNLENDVPGKATDLASEENAVSAPSATPGPKPATPAASTTTPRPATAGAGATAATSATAKSAKATAASAEKPPTPPPSKPALTAPATIATTTKLAETATATARPTAATAATAAAAAAAAVAPAATVAAPLAAAAAGSAAAASCSTMTSSSIGRVAVCCRVRPVLPNELANNVKKAPWVVTHNSISLPEGRFNGHRSSNDLGAFNSSSNAIGSSNNNNSNSNNNSNNGGGSNTHSNGNDAIASMAMSKSRMEVRGLDHLKREEMETVLDHVFGETATTKQVYDESFKGIVAGAAQGLNGAILAYGQTASGKTYSISGSSASSESPDGNSGKDRGIIHFALQDLFSMLQEQSRDKHEFLVRMSYCELYLERVNDLLRKISPQSQNLPVKEDTENRGFYVEGLKEKIVNSPEEVVAQLQQAEKRRRVAYTRFNEVSSRSHTILTLCVERSSSLETDDVEVTRVGRLVIVDLAGNERVEAGTEYMAESSSINQSLFFLGKVIEKLALRDRKKSRMLGNSLHAETVSGEEGLSRRAEDHIPIRDSKLTRLLSVHLSGNSQTGLLVTMTPAEEAVESSLTTLRFAQKAGQVKCIPKPVLISKEQSLILKQKEIIAQLQSQVRDLQAAAENLPPRQQQDLRGGDVGRGVDNSNSSNNNTNSNSNNSKKTSNSNSPEVRSAEKPPPLPTTPRSSDAAEIVAERQERLEQIQALTLQSGSASSPGKQAYVSKSREVDAVVKILHQNNDTLKKQKATVIEQLKLLHRAISEASSKVGHAAKLLSESAAGLDRDLKTELPQVLRLATEGASNSSAWAPAVEELYSKINTLVASAADAGRTEGKSEHESLSAALQEELESLRQENLWLRTSLKSLSAEREAPNKALKEMPGAGASLMSGHRGPEDREQAGLWAPQGEARSPSLSLSPSRSAVELRGQRMGNATTASPSAKWEAHLRPDAPPLPNSTGPQIPVPPSPTTAMINTNATTTTATTTTANTARDVKGKQQSQQDEAATPFRDRIRADDDADHAFGGDNSSNKNNNSNNSNNSQPSHIARFANTGSTNNGVSSPHNFHTWAVGAGGGTGSTESPTNARGPSDSDCPADSTPTKMAKLQAPGTFDSKKVPEFPSLDAKSVPERANLEFKEPGSEDPNSELRGTSEPSKTTLDVGGSEHPDWSWGDFEPILERGPSKEQGPPPKSPENLKKTGNFDDFEPIFERSEAVPPPGGHPNLFCRNTGPSPPPYHQNTSVYNDANTANAYNANMGAAAGSSSSSSSTSRPNDITYYQQGHSRSVSNSSNNNNSNNVSSSFAVSAVAAAAAAASSSSSASCRSSSSSFPLPRYLGASVGTGQASYLRQLGVKTQWQPGDVAYWRGQVCRVLKRIPEDNPVMVALRTPEGSEVTAELCLLSEAPSNARAPPMQHEGHPTDYGRQSRLAPLGDLCLDRPTVQRPPSIPSYAEQYQHQQQGQSYYQAGASSNRSNSGGRRTSSPLEPLPSEKTRPPSSSSSGQQQQRRVASPSRLVPLAMGLST